MFKNKYKNKNLAKLPTLILITILICSTFNILSYAKNNRDSPISIDYIGYPTSAIERDEIKMTVFIKNIGTVNLTGKKINVSLFVDNDLENLSAFNTTADIDIDEIKLVNLTWKTEKTELGDSQNRTLNFIVEFETYSEKTDKYIIIYERDTDLTFSGSPFVEGQTRVNQTVTINAMAQNIGKSTDQDINVSLYIENNYLVSTIINGLSKDEKYNLSFEWIPNFFGEFKAVIYLDKENIITEQDESNNRIEIFINVDVARFEWWDVNWHYRKAYRLNGTGNISIEVNFTKYLENLSLYGQNFENETIVIVEYLRSGEVVGVVENFYFNESIGFNPINNATGILSWYVHNDTYYYCVYFDVGSNSGLRNNFEENLDLNLSNQDVKLDFIGYNEGWWSEWSDDMPLLNNYYLPYENKVYNEDEMHLKINTNAIASNVIANFVCNNTFIENKTLFSIDGLVWEVKQNFTRIGNWNLTIISIDEAGYKNSELTHNFYVGYPDLTINDLCISSPSSQYGTFYESTDIAIKANVVSYNTSVYDVNVSLLIDDEYVISEYLDVLKNNNNIVDFIWSFKENGTYNVKIHVDYDNNIIESNESNNSINQDIIIEGRPDIGITNLKIPSELISEGERVDFSAEIHNYGRGNATHYRINLYIEQNDENNDGILDEKINYKDERNHTYVDIKINKTKNISIAWDAAEYGSLGGEWVVGMKIISNSSYPDSNTSNNKISSLPDHLKIKASKPREKNKPRIQLINPLSSEKFEQEKIVEIRAKITDNSGIKNVELEIINPNGKKYSDQMLYDTDDEYYFEFRNTDILGKYNFNLTAYDNSFYKNKAILRNNFIIVKDFTPPKIRDVRTSPSKQLKNEDVKITSIVIDNSDLKYVKVTIINPDGLIDTKNMEHTNIDNKYIHSNSFEELGKYNYYISAEDNYGNKIDTQSENKDFWITNDLEDIDSDGMPDWWEEKYGFDPYDPTDAKMDEDEDGFTNVEEFELGTDPLTPVTYLENLVIRLIENGIYLFLSILFFIILFCISLYGWRRETL